MTRDDFRSEWSRLCAGFGEGEPHPIRLEALFQRFGNRGLPVLREFVNALLLDSRMPNAERLAKVFADVIARRQEFESSAFKAQSPTQTDLSRCSTAYAQFRARLCLRIQDVALTPQQVADELEFMRATFPDEIDLTEISTLRLCADWAEVARRIIGKRSSTDWQPFDYLWDGPGRWRLRSPMMPGESEPLL